MGSSSASYSGRYVDLHVTGLSLMSDVPLPHADA